MVCKFREKKIDLQLSLVAQSDDASPAVSVGVAYSLVHSFAFAIALSSCLTHSSATSLARGSFGFGDASKAWTDKRTVLICKAGDQLFFNTSRHILPNLTMFGWYILVKNLTFGASIG